MEIKLKVAEAVQDDVNKGIVRLDTSILKEMGARPGDIVEIKGERKTLGIADRAYPGDIGLNIIRMDGILRRNSKTGIGEVVTVSKAEVKEAKKVIIAPARKGVIVKASPFTFKKGLLGRAVMKGDIVSLGGTKTRRSTMSRSPFFEEIFDMLENEEYFGGFGFQDLKFIIVDTTPKGGGVIISDNTEIAYNAEAVELKEDEELPDVSYEDIGGLNDEIKKVREMVELPLKHPEIFERLGIEPPKGVLLHGPPGTGKTLLAKAVANETNSHFILINGPEIMSKFYGQSEENLRKKFEEAQENAPSIIFIDEIDAIASKREETHGEVEKRVVAQLLAIMDGLQSRGKVVVLAATNIPNVLDPALRRPGRFDREIEIGVPDKNARLNILKIHTRHMPLYTLDDSIKAFELDDRQKEMLSTLSPTIDLQNKPSKKELEKLIEKHLAENSAKGDLFKAVDIDKLHKSLTQALSDQNIVDLKEIASITHGFVGADLAALSKEAAMVVLRRILPDLKLDEEEPIPNELLEKLQITKTDIKEALKFVRPSALREVFVEIPNVTWDKVGGLLDVKQELKEAVEWPLKHPEAFKRLGIRPPKGILLYGPPGTGKTLLAKAVAKESEANFILVKGPELLSKWVGESERGVRKVFDKARQASPTIIFFDEIDSIAPKRGSSSDAKVTERVVNQMLTEMDGLEELNDVVVIGATNRPDILDTALLRPGRFDRIILTPAPDQKTREEIFRVHLKDMSLDKDIDIKALSEKTEGYVGADIESICREAGILALREDIKAKKVSMKFFDKALEKVMPSVTEEIQKSYESLKEFFSSAHARRMKEEKPGYFG